MADTKYVLRYLPLFYEELEEKEVSILSYICKKFYSLLCCN
jgi:hypothetical protein